MRIYQCLEIILHQYHTSYKSQYNDSNRGLRFGKYGGLIYISHLLPHIRYEIVPDITEQSRENIYSYSSYKAAKKYAHKFLSVLFRHGDTVTSQCNIFFGGRRNFFQEKNKYK